MWEIEEEKLIWPYTLYNSIDEIKQSKNFPKYSEFSSELRGGELPDKNLYIKIKTDFARKRLLPKNHPDKLYSMLGFLKVYNKADVGPLAQAIQKMFECYDLYFR